MALHVAHFVLPPLDVTRLRWSIMAVMELSVAYRQV